MVWDPRTRGKSTAVRCLPYDHPTEQGHPNLALFDLSLKTDDNSGRLISPIDQTGVAYSVRRAQHHYEVGSFRSSTKNVKANEAFSIFIGPQTSLFY